MTTPSSRRVSRDAIQASAWSYASLAGGRALTFVSTIILARILVPEHFGLVALCLMAIQYFEILNMFGLDGAVIAEDDRSLQASANMATLASLGLGSALYLIAWVSAPAIAAFFGEPQFESLFRVLALILPIAGLGVVPGALLQRSLRFRRKLVPDLSKGLVKGGVAIVLAWQGFEAWSLIYAQIASAMTETVLNYAMSGWRPTWEFDRQVTRRVLSFGGHITSVGILGALRNNVDYLLIGRILGATALGYYSVAYRLPELIVRTINYAVSKVMFPVLAQARQDRSDLQAFYLAYVRYIALLTVPAGIGIAVLAPTLVETLFSDTWEPAVPVMQLIAVAVAIASIGHVPGVLYKAVGRPDVLNRLSILKVPPIVAMLWFSTRWGINGVAAAQVAIAGFSLLIDSYYVTRFTTVSWRAMGTALVPAVTGATIMAATTIAAQLLTGLEGFPAIGVMVPLGAIAFVLSVAAISRQTIAEATAALRGAVARA